MLTIAQIFLVVFTTNPDSIPPVVVRTFRGWLFNRRELLHKPLVKPPFWLKLDILIETEAAFNILFLSYGVIYSPLDRFDNLARGGPAKAEL